MIAASDTNKNILIFSTVFLQVRHIYIPDRALWSVICTITEHLISERKQIQLQNQTIFNLSSYIFSYMKFGFWRISYSNSMSRYHTELSKSLDILLTIFSPSMFLTTGAEAAPWIRSLKNVIMYEHCVCLVLWNSCMQKQSIRQVPCTS